MQKHPSCSFHSSQSVYADSQIESKEKSILRQYNRLHTDIETPQYSQQFLPYCDLPKFMPKDLTKMYSQCVYLDRFTFYEMFTMLIVEYLFKSPTQAKINKIKHFKALICSADFLQGSLFTKGLIIKALRSVEQATNNKELNHPLGQSLLNCDCICAFTECWKQLICRICKENNMPVLSQNDIDSSIFELFASYFHISFDVYWKEKNNKLWKEHFTFSNANAQTDTLVVVVNPQYQISISQRCIKVTDSGISLHESNRSNHEWNYLFLTNPPIVNSKYSKSSEPQEKAVMKMENQAEMANGQEISRISEIEYSCGETEQIKILLQEKITQSQTIKKMGKTKNKNQAEQAFTNILSTMGKANSLIEHMRKFSEYLETLRTPELRVNKICPTN